MWSKERGGRGKIFVFRIAKEEDAMEDFKLRISCKIRKEKEREREKKKKTEREQSVCVDTLDQREPAQIIWFLLCKFPLHLFSSHSHSPTQTLQLTLNQYYFFFFILPTMSELCHF